MLQGKSKKYCKVLMGLNTIRGWPFCTFPVELRHESLVFGKHLVAEIRGHTRIRRLIGGRLASLYGFFQACEKRFARVAAFHMLFQLRTQRIVQFLVQVIGKLFKHLFAAPFARMRLSHRRLLFCFASSALPILLREFPSNEKPRSMQPHTDCAWTQP